MFEADRYCLLGVLFAGFISLSSMSTYWSLEEYEGLDWLADTLAILWIGVGMCALAWTKSWMNVHPSTQVNHSSFGRNKAFLTTAVACSMTSIILFVVYAPPPKLKVYEYSQIVALCEKVGWRHFSRCHSSS
jgi:hypothetical protein